MIEADKAKADNEKKNLELCRCFKRMSKTKDGKEVLKALEDYCGQNKSSVCRTSPNPYQTMYVEGMRAIWLYINDKINRKEKKDA